MEQQCSLLVWKLEWGGDTEIELGNANNATSNLGYNKVGSFETNDIFDGTGGSVAERSPAGISVAGSIPARNKYMYDRVWLFVYVISMSVNAPTMQEKFVVWGND